MVSEDAALVQIRILPGNLLVKEKLMILCKIKERNRTLYSKQIKEEKRRRTIAH